MPQFNITALYRNHRNEESSEEELKTTQGDRLSVFLAGS